MESSLVSAGHNIQHPYVRKEHSYVREEHSYVREERSTFSDCFDGKYSLPSNLEEDMELKEFDVIKYTTTSDCFNGNYAPTHNPYTEDMLDLKPFDLINYITTDSSDSSCNIPMETGSQQTHSAWDVDHPGVEASKRQNIPDSLCNTPMETGSQQEQVVAKDEDPEFQELSDQLLEWKDELLDLKDKKRESMYKTEEVNVYGSKLSSLGQNIPDSLCNTPMETGSQQTSSAWDVDRTGVEASKSAAYQSMNVLHDDTPITTDSQQKQMETKGHQRAKQLREKYKPALPTIEREHPLKHFYSRMQIEPCLGTCISTPNVSALHNTHCVLHNRPLLQELQNKNPNILQQVKEHLTNINMDRDDFKNLLFHEKLSKMLDKIECALAYIGSCYNKYIYLLAFKLQLTELVTRVRNSHPNPVIEFLRHMNKKTTNVDKLILELMQKDMSYYQLKVDLNNMLDMMSHHEYAEMGESYYHGLELESRIDTFIENYKMVKESVKEKLDIQNNYTDCESISLYYKDYNEYLNLLINSLDETNSVTDNNSVFVEDPIISNPHIKVFYDNMDTAYYNRLYRQNRNICKLTTTSDIYLFMKDLSRLLDATEELHMELESTLEILSNRGQTDVVIFNKNIRTAIAQIRIEKNKTYLSEKELGRMEMKKTIRTARAQICIEKNKTYLSVKELGRMEMKKTLVYINTKVPIKAYRLSLSCMGLCMWSSLERGSTACKTVKENLSSICKELGSELQFLEEYIDYQKNLIDELKTKWFPKKMGSPKKQKTQKKQKT